MNDVQITWVIAGIVGAAAAFDLLTTSVGEARKSFEALEEVTSELESTQSELTSINDKIAEIQSKGKLELTDKIELQKLETERDILEDQVKLLELKKELAADKSNKDAVDAVGNPMRGFGKKTRDGWTTSYGAVDIILDGTSRKSGQGSLIDAYEDLAEIEEQIRNTNQSDTKKLTKLYEKKSDIQADINEDKNTLADVYSENLELLEQMTGDDPATQAAREKLETQNQKIAQYIFSAEEIAQKSIEKFKSNFATHYNKQLDLIQNDEMHFMSEDVVKDGKNLGIRMTGVTEAGLDGLTNKAKELNQSFVDGKITVSEYFNNLSKEIEAINLDDVGKNLDGGKGDNAYTDYIEQTIATLTSQVSDAMLYASTSFKAGEISVGDYIDTLTSGMDTQKKLLKSTYNLKENEKGLITVTNEMDEATSRAAASFNRLAKTQNDLSGLDAFADEFGAIVDKMMEAGYIEGENISEKLLGDPALFSQTVTTLSGEMQRLVENGTYSTDELAGKLASSFGKSKEEIAAALTGAEGDLETLVGNNINAVNGMEDVAAKNASNTITNASQAIGTVLKALGNAIANFNYKVEFTPFGTVDKEVDMFNFDKETGKFTFTSPASFGFEIKGSEGSDGSSAQSISEAINSAADYFNQSASTPIDSITDWGSINDTNNRSNSRSSSNSGSRKDSSKDAEKAAKEALEKFKEGLDTRKKLIDKYKEAVDLTDFGLDLAEENDFALRADLLNNKMSQLTSYGTAMREEFDRVASIIPKTGEEAEALASHLETLGSDMRDNIKNLRETRVAMEQLKVSSITAMSENYLGDLESELSNIEKRIELLNKDNKNDYKHTNHMLQMEMLLPTKSSSVGAQNSRRKADQGVIGSEQATQDVLNDMFETQIKMNDKLREDERQALLEDMETMRQDVVLKLESVNKDYDSSWQTAQDTTNTGITNIENSLNNMDMKIPAPDISAVITACEQVKDMLDHMGDADYTPPKLRISDGIDGGDANSIIRGNKPNIVSNVAKNQLGVPYVWGGIAPGEGLDCSGLTQYAYGVAGVSLPRRSQEQWSCGTGTRIDWKDLKKGDQLFFGSSGEATHTGIYVGNGQMIHAPHTGDVVKYSSIESEYYQSNFLGAKRYAVGTPGGNAQAYKFGIAGENFKPEILIDKITGETRYIDTPTLIDVTRTDVVGEKATAGIPKFATGTVNPMDIAAYIRQKYPEITDNAIAGILGNIEQESSFNPKNKTVEAYGSGSNKQIARWGLFQLDDTRISNWSSIVASGDWRKQIDTALAEGRYANSGMGNSSKHNMWQYLTDSSLSASEQAVLWDKLYERSDGKSRNKRAANAEKYLAQIQGNTDALNANTSAIEEKKTDASILQELRTLAEGGNVNLILRPEIDSSLLKEVSWDIEEGIATVFSSTISNTDFEDLIPEDLKDTIAINFTPIIADPVTGEYIGVLSKDELYNYAHDVISKVRTDDLNLQIGSVFKGEGAIDSATSAAKNIHELHEAISGSGKLDVYKIQEIPNALASAIDNITADSRARQLEILDDDSISDREKSQKLFEVYNPVAEKAAAYADDIHSYAIKEFIAWREQAKARGEWRQEIEDAWYDTIEKLGDQGAEIEENKVSQREAMLGYTEDILAKHDKYIEDRNFYNDWELFGDSEEDVLKRQIAVINDAYLRGEFGSEEAYNAKLKEFEQRMYTVLQDKMLKQLDIAISKVGSLKTLLQSHFDITNTISDSQYQLNKELTASKTMYEYLDKDTRKLLFNQEDYNILAEELNSIQDKANKLQDEYNDKIRHATAENLDEITSKYEMQYNLLMKSYEIKKADLEITKKQQQLNNVLNERNVRMFINGQWRWVANTQDVINAQNELAEAQYAKQQAINSKNQTKEMNELTRAENTLTTTINNVENGIVEFDDQVGDINKTLKSINVNELPSLKNVLGNAASAISSFVKEIKRAKIDTPISYSKNIDYSTEMQNSAYTADGKEYLNDSKRNSKIEGEGLSYPAHDNIDFSHYDPVGNAYKENDYMQEIIDKANKGDLKGALIANKNRNHKIDYLGLDSATKFTDDDIKALVKTQDIDRPNYNANAYATGTNNATQGFSKLGEIEDELFINSHGRLIPINQPTLTNMQGGEMVFNGAQLAGARALWEMVNMPSFGVNNLPIIDRAQSSQSTVDNRIIINGMTVDSGSPEGQALIDAFRRYIPTHS